MLFVLNVSSILFYTLVSNKVAQIKSKPLLMAASSSDCITHFPLLCFPSQPCLTVLVLFVQVDFAKVLHYVGAGVAFPSSMMFVCLQSALTYRLAKTQEEYRLGHFRVGMALVALIALVLSGVFFCQESFALQHTSAIFEWIYCMIIMLFYGTFAFEFGGMSAETLMVLSRGGRLNSFTPSEEKKEVCRGTVHLQADSLTIL
uniref:CWH43-like N-terminal domain-containing protein n=2 Tax=Nothobranchius kuhntae TaxID=321403 RepID=A0A1A8I840_NOTKU